MQLRQLCQILGMGLAGVYLTVLKVLPMFHETSGLGQSFE